MKLKVKDMDIATGGKLIAILNQNDAKKLDLHSGDRILIKHNSHSTTCVLDISESKKAVPEGKVGLFEEVLDKIKVKQGSIVKISLTGKPESVKHIRDKLHGKRLNYKELLHIMDDITNDRLTDIEKTYFVAADFINGLSTEEVVDMTKAMVEAGKKIKFKGITLDKHCLSADVPIIVKNSSKIKVKTMGNITDSLFELCHDDIILRDGAEYLEKNPKNIQVLTFGDDGKVKFAQVTGFFRAPSPENLHEIKLLGNRKVKVTPDHTIFVLKKGKITNIPAKEITKGDFVIVPSGLESSVKPATEIKVEETVNSRFKSIESIKIDSEFIRLLAYYIAEGFTNQQGIFLNFGAHEKELIEDAKHCVKKVFGFEPTINVPHQTATRVTIYSQMVSKLFKNTIRAGSNALEKNIPSFVFELRKELQLEFLQALFKCDGYVRRGYEAVYVTASKQLYLDLQYFLSLLGISVSLSHKGKGRRMFPTGEYDVADSYYIYTQAREIYGQREKANVSFINLLPIKELGEINDKKVGWEFRRSLKRQKFITKDKLRDYSYAFSSPDVHNIINGNLSVLPVKENKTINSDSKFVYDFYVEGYNKFMAGTAPMAVHNCVGGVPGNRTTMVVIPIIAAAGFIIPKTSSRAITSPAGTADTMECLAKVELPESKIKKVVRKTGACIVHGGSMQLAPADDKIIDVEHPLSIDAEGQLLASVMAKKYSVSANHVLIDIPMGKSTKANNWSKAKHLRKMFHLIGRRLGMDVKVIVTNGSQPVGKGVGPLLEAEDVMAVLRNDPLAPEDLKRKALMMASILLEMTGKYRDGAKVAREILESGKAYEKMKSIIKAQGKSRKPLLGKFRHEVKSSKKGKVRDIDNEVIAKIARIAGNPDDKGAGLYLNKKVDDPVKKGELLYTVYAENKFKLDLAKEFLRRNKGYLVR